MKITRLVVGRGLSREQKYGKEWMKQYYQVEAELSPSDNIGEVKKQLQAQLEEWLK